MDITNYTIDLALKPTTLDAWHVCLAGTSAILAGALILTLLSLVMCMARRKENNHKSKSLKKLYKQNRLFKLLKKLSKFLLNALLKLKKSSKFQHLRQSF
jgi:hypothetical protein